MNIFRLHDDPRIAAEMHCDKHVVKMILESAQMLSTAHRVLDGKKVGRKWIHNDPLWDGRLYGAVHVNHPCTIWTRESRSNYNWHFFLFTYLSNEYTFRYGKNHATFEKLGNWLFYPPYNIPEGDLTPFRCATGGEQFVADPVAEYRRYYQTKQDKFDMRWTKRDVPDWFDRTNSESQTALSES